MIETNRTTKLPPLLTGVLAMATLPAILGAPTAAAAQEGEMQEVTIEATRAGGTVYMLTGRGGNIGTTVGEEGALIVDDQFAPLAPRIRATLDSLASGDVRYVLNTHWHGDHTGGNVEFGPEAPIIAQVNVRERLATEQTLRGEPYEPLPAEGLPVVTYADSVSVHFNGEEIRVVHYPAAHTDGDAVVFFRGSNVVHMGDVFFAGRFPFVDLASGGSVQGVLAAVEAVLARIPEGATVIPGHGPLSDVGGLREYRRMLVSTIGHVRGRMEEGAGLQQLQAEGLPPEWEGWGSDFIPQDRWIETIYRSLTR